jgi:hypothetical protein
MQLRLGGTEGGGVHLHPTPPPAPQSGAFNLAERHIR